MSTHHKSECKHGTLVSQCRCPAPDKEVRIVPCPKSCNDRPAEDEVEVDHLAVDLLRLPDACCCDVHKVGGVGCGMCAVHDSVRVPPELQATPQDFKAEYEGHWHEWIVNSMDTLTGNTIGIACIHCPERAVVANRLPIEVPHA